MNSRRLLELTLLLFLISCVFDPADLLLGLKVYLYLFCWLITVILCAANREQCRVHVGLLIYTLLFILVPVLSVTWYWFVNGGEPFEGFQLLKGYVLITLGALLYINRINFLAQLSAVLTVLALAVILVFLAVSMHPDLMPLLYVFGNQTGIVLIDNRDYGSGVTLLQIYFVTSPMLAISIAYYFGRARAAPGRKWRMRYGLLMLINMIGMLLAGTRNNIAVSLLLPLALFFLYSRRKLATALLGTSVIALLAIVFFEQLQALLDPSEVSNNTKLLLLQDYGDVLSDAGALLFGQGLGAYHFWAAKAAYFYISELTYLEMIRNFGAFGALLMFALVFFPVFYTLIMNRSYREKHIIVGYAFYLFMCVSNPNLFSSMGILILSVLLANLFLLDRRDKQPGRHSAA